MNLGLRQGLHRDGRQRGIGAAPPRMLAQEGARVLPSRAGDDLELDITAPDAAERLLAAVPRAALGAREQRRGQPGPPARGAERRRLAGAVGAARDGADAADACARAAMAEAGGGRIVNVSSSSGKRPSGPLDPAYSVTKAAQLSLVALFADPGRPRACW